MQTMSWSCDVRRRRYVLLIGLLISFGLYLKLFVFTSRKTLTKIRNSKAGLGTPRLSAHKSKYQLDVGLLKKNVIPPRKHAEFSVIPWNINVSESRASLFHDSNIAERWSSVAIVKSGLQNKDRRDAIRETWGKFKFMDGVRLETVFLLGSTSDKEIQAELTKESKKYGDILQSDIPDSKENVPLKILAGMRWVALNFPDDWLYSSADDDFGLHSPNFVRYVEHVRREKDSDPSQESLPILCVYAYKTDDKPDRKESSKWYVSPDQYSLESWPPYCRGGWYSMPVKTASKLYEISRITPIFFLDDVWITGILRLLLYNRESDSMPAGSRLSEQGIVSAPLADRTDVQLYYRELEDDLDKTIVSHTWAGDYGWFAHNIADDIRMLWDKWEASAHEKIKYVVTFS